MSAIVRTVQLAFDCADPDEIIRFWIPAAGFENQFAGWSKEQLVEWRKDYPQYDGRGRIDDAGGHRMPVYMQAVPEPKVGRNRIRPEISTRDVEQVGDHVDVEGNEYSVVHADVDTHVSTIRIDALDPVRMLEFWSLVTGYEPRGNRCDSAPGSRVYEDGVLFVDGQPAGPMPFNPDASGVVFDLVPGLAFMATEEPKTHKNRLHFDLHTMDHEAVRDHCLKLGATVQRWDTEHVLLDPEGNEFCV